MLDEFHEGGSLKRTILMPAIWNCIHSLEALMNDAGFQSLESVMEINARLESWRTDYNRQAGSA
ncbi:hypothetical protein [Paraburkholderia fungorum]|uniref:hypothetical protein n=1 Tax=Paraburkholderia fungorum TaxID=134537 RepID=UPI0038BCB7F1